VGGGGGASGRGGAHHRRRRARQRPSLPVEELPSMVVCWRRRKRKREKGWAVAAGKRQGEILRGRMENDGRPSDASDVRLEAFPLIFFRSRDRDNKFGLQIYSRA
jgi:hypothetical protein